MSALPPKADIATSLKALADDLADASADIITEASVKVGAPATAAHRNGQKPPPIS
jgi:hypothetical protein